MTEIWKPIPELRGYYEASNAGRIRSVDRKILTRNGRLITYRGKVKNLFVSRTGYLQARVSLDNSPRWLFAHHGVLQAFVGPRIPGAVTMHLNNDPKDNRLENLRWGTQKENIEQSVREGRNANLRKTHCPRGHLLISPNLRESDLQKGKRCCKSCARAFSYLYYHKLDRDDLTRISNDFYHQFTGMSPEVTA